MAPASAHSSAAVLHGVEDIRLEARPVAAPAAGQALIRVHSVGICGSDMHYFRRVVFPWLWHAAVFGVCG
jgi:D-arabinose 1-dehydrogenase-like Zn-dependent alcohol dehydrogenase